MATDFLLFEKALSEYKKISEQNTIEKKKSFDEDDTYDSQDETLPLYLSDKEIEDILDEDILDKEELIENDGKCLHKNIVNENGKFKLKLTVMLFISLIEYQALFIIYYVDTFFLASCSEPQSKMESKDLNEQMYLVVRSLKHNNVKIVT